MIFKCFLVLLCTNVYLAWKLHKYISETLYTDKNYVVGRSGWTGDYNDPMTFLGMFLSYSPQNHALFTNKEYDGLLQTAMGTIDQNIRMDAMHKAEKILMDNI